MARRLPCRPTPYEMPDLPLFLTVALVHVLALASPGPDFLFVSQTAISRARRQALAGVAGIVLGIGVWATLALLGLHVLLDQLAWLQRVIVIAGGAYLAWLGICLLRAAWRPQSVEVSAAVPHGAWRCFRRGLLTNLSNPKAVVYFASVFSGLIGPTVSAAARGWLLALVLLESLVWFVTVAVVFGLPTLRRGYLHASRWIDAGAGAAFIGFGVVLILRGA